MLIGAFRYAIDPIHGNWLNQRITDSARAGDGAFDEQSDERGWADRWWTCHRRGGQFVFSACRLVDPRL